jgi:hypothetical protein
MQAGGNPLFTHLMFGFRNENLADKNLLCILFFQQTVI